MSMTNAPSFGPRDQPGHDSDDDVAAIAEALERWHQRNGLRVYGPRSQRFRSMAQFLVDDGVCQ